MVADDAQNVRGSVICLLCSKYLNRAVVLCGDIPVFEKNPLQLESYGNVFFATSPTCF